MNSGFADSDDPGGPDLALGGGGATGIWVLLLLLLAAAAGLAPAVRRSA